MKEIEMNKAAWSLLSKEHYETFKKRLIEEDTLINKNILSELGDIKNKSLIHLQCNIGQDTISLLREGLKEAVGVDLSDQNIFYGNKLKNDFHISNLELIEANVLDFDKAHDKLYDIVFTSEGVLGWLPDLKRWAEVVSNLLKEDGFFYVYDSHPFFHIFDEELLADKQELKIKYDYFDAKADKCMDIGGYACETKHGENYWWNHSMSDVINALIEAGLEIKYFHEFDTLFWNNGNMVQIDKSLYQYPKLIKKLPMSYSIKAVKKNNK